MTDFWEGLIAGTFLGLMVGVLWEEAYELVRDAWNEKRNKVKKTTKHRSVRERVESWDVANVLAVMSVMLVFMGGAMIIQYAQLNSFIRCQGDYNESTASVRDQRVEDGAKQDRKLFKWIESIRPLLTEDGPRRDIQDVEDTRQALEELLEAHEELLDTQKENPYKTPEDFCG